MKKFELCRNKEYQVYIFFSLFVMRVIIRKIKIQSNRRYKIFKFNSVEINNIKNVNFFFSFIFNAGSGQKNTALIVIEDEKIFIKMKVLRVFLKSLMNQHSLLENVSGNIVPFFYF